MKKTPQVWIVDFGSQYTQLIARKTRELGYTTIIKTFEKTSEDLEKRSPKALILSGGPQSVFENSNNYESLFSPNIPVLGICYGMQLMAHYFGGKVERGGQGEYGRTEITFTDSSFVGKKEVNVWMSHFDEVKKLPESFEKLAHSRGGIIAGMKHKNAPLWAFQFHPEVEHTERGKDLLLHFLEKIACLEKDWDSFHMLEETEESLRGLEEEKVLCAFSGGVDSLVAASIAQRKLGKNLYCFFVDHGLLRPQDHEHIKTLQKESSLQIEVIDAKEEFLEKLKSVSDPEKKRKIIGNTFIDIFDKKVSEYAKEKNIHFSYLLQGTLYPDIIESLSPHGKDGKSVTIKSHHNVGGLPEKMNLKLVEPLKFLFKDEVRSLGEFLKLPKGWLYRHPFPGPGVGIRIMGEISSEAILAVQNSDRILFDELKKWNLYDDIWQAFTVFLPVQTVGVKGDGRAYENVICLRLVNSTDGMTAQFSHVNHDFLACVSSRITNEVSGITRVVYDITSKPPGTIEWE